MLEDVFQTAGLTLVDNIPSETMSVKLPRGVGEDFLVMLPEITTDADIDISNYESLTTIYREMDLLPGDVQNHFTKPITFMDLSVKYPSGSFVFSVPVFSPAIPYSPTREERVMYMERLFSSVLTKGVPDQFYKLFLQLDTSIFVAEPSVRLLLLPRKGDSDIIEYLNDNPRLKNLLECIRLQALGTAAPVSMDVLDQVFTDMRDVWLLPKEGEIREYSLDRIPRSDEHCYPILWDNNILTETTPGNADHFIKFRDVSATFKDPGRLQEDFFSVFLVYLAPKDDESLQLKIAIARMNFSELGSKHAHLVTNLLPDNFHYLFSGEMILENGDIKYNLNSGMFYHMHKARGKVREFTQDVGSFDISGHPIEYNYVRSHLFPETLCWESLSEIVMESILGQPVTFAGNIKKPRLSISRDQIEEHCQDPNFSFLVFPTKQKCSTNDKKATNLCK
jgi:hypothetical protein